MVYRGFTLTLFETYSESSEYVSNKSDTNRKSL